MNEHLFLLHSRIVAVPALSITIEAYDWLYTPYNKSTNSGSVCQSHWNVVVLAHPDLRPPDGCLLRQDPFHLKTFSSHDEI